MKRLLILLILSLIPFLLFSESSESTERVITGIKKGADIPDPFAVLDVYGSESESIVNNSRIVVSDVMRNKSYEAFSWIFTGNYYTAVQLKYTFSPLTCNTNLAEAAEDEIIPYTVKVIHGSTTSGGKEITSTKLANDQGIQGDFDGYYYCLGESVKYNGSDDPVTLSVSNAAQSVTLNYDFSSNSEVVKKGVGNTFQNVENYNKKVCCLWTRSGYAEFVLKISDEGFSIPEGNADPVKFVNGEYSCTVVVEITQGS